MKEYQQRVLDEKLALDNKIAKLMLFINTPEYLALDAEEQARLRQQRLYMMQYARVLNDRIRAFK